MSTLLQLVNEVLRRTGQTEVSTLLSAETPVKQTVDFLNEAYQDMLFRLRVNRLQQKMTLSTVIDQDSYVLPSTVDINHLLGDSLFIEGDTEALQQVDYTYPEKHGADIKGKPLGFFVRGDELVLYPTPDAVYKVTYESIKVPLKLSLDGDVTELPAEWEVVLVLGTQTRLERFLGEPSADETFFLYREGLMRLVARGMTKTYYRMKGNYQGWQGS